jgi:hypothetical protein
MRSLLKLRGFKSSGTTFHSAAPNQFIDVINLQGGVRSLAGRCAVNLGIYIPEYEVVPGKVASPHKEYDCVIRARLSTLVFGEDVWFDCSDPGAAELISNLLSSHGLPWFERLSTLAAVAEELKAGRLSNRVGWGMHAAILKDAGETETARSFLRGLQGPSATIIEAFAASIGIDLN